MNPVFKDVARYVRDLLQYDEQLIKIGRVNEEQESSGVNYIAVDSVQQARRISSGTSFDGDTEQEDLYARYNQIITLSFYGEDAYQNADDFLMLQKSQLSLDLQYTHGISVFGASNIIDIKQLLGSTYANRLDISFTVSYNKQKTINTLRIDELQSEFLIDK